MFSNLQQQLIFREILPLMIQVIANRDPFKAVIPNNLKTSLGKFGCVYFIPSLFCELEQTIYLSENGNKDTLLCGCENCRSNIT